LSPAEKGNTISVPVTLDKHPIMNIVIKSCADCWFDKTRNQRPQYKRENDQNI